ncbi:MAG: hypothetical protein WCP21_06450, partial [Armatimonadota bacterium]
MLSRLSTHVKLTLLALALVIVPGALVVMGQSGWAHQRLQEIVTRQLAASLKREVSVGPISGNVLTNLTINGLAIAEHARLAEGAVVSVERVQVNYDLLSLLRGRLSPAASVRSIHVYNARLHLVREPSGRLNLQALLPPARVTPVSKRFRGRVFVHNATALYEDYSRYVKTPPEAAVVAS